MRRTARAAIISAVLMIGSPVVTAVTAGAAATTLSNDAAYADNGVLVLERGSAVRDSELDPNGGLYTAGTVTTTAGVYWRVEHIDALGAHDQAFGTGGTVMLKARNAGAYLVGLEVRGDTIFLVGSDGERGFTVIALTKSGEVDRSFGTRGQVQISLAGTSLVSIADVDVTVSGRIVVLGNLADPASRLRTSSFVARLTPRGARDRSFATNGIAIADVTTGAVSQNITQVAVDSKERVIVAGSRIAPVGQEMVVLRLSASGERDPGFGVRGLRIVQPVKGAVSAVSAIVVRADDSLALGGWTRTGTAREPVQSVVVVSFTAAGRLDDSLASDGIARIIDRRFSSQVTTDLAVRADGSMVLSTSPVGLDPRPALVVRITKAGALATTAGVGGVTSLTYVPGQRSWTQTILDAGDHLYVLGGTALGTGTPSGAIARYNVS